MKKKHIFLSVLVILLLVLYLIPATQQDFITSYKKDDKASQSFVTFMKKPTKEILINTIKWEYLSYGKGTKTILFIHGMGGAYNLWWQQMEFFKDNYRVISYTLPEEINNLQDASDGVLKILEQEQVENLYVVGTSMGGYIAQYLTHKIPSRIEKVVFGNTFPPNMVIETKNKTKSEVIPWLPEIVISKLGQKNSMMKLFLQEIILSYLKPFYLVYLLVKNSLLIGIMWLLINLFRILICIKSNAFLN